MEMTPPNFRILVLVILVSTIAIMLPHRLKARTGEKLDRRQEGAILIPLRLCGLVAWTGILVYIIRPGWMEWSELELPAWLRWAGVGLGLSCLGLLYWTVSTLGSNLTDTVVTRARHTLVTNGPYRWVRHPLYLTALLLFVSLSLVSASWFLALAFSPAFVLLVIRTGKEEQKLAERFGDEYRQYTQRTGRFFPRFGTR